jgi:hypothetical protein
MVTLGISKSSKGGGPTPTRIVNVGDHISLYYIIVLFYQYPLHGKNCSNFFV